MESTTIQPKSGDARNEKGEDGEVQPPAQDKQLEVGTGRDEGAEAMPRTDGGLKEDGMEEKEVGEAVPPATALKKAEEQVVVGGEGGGMEEAKDGGEAEAIDGEVAAAVEALVDGVVRAEEEEEAALLATGVENDVSTEPLEIGLR